MVGLAKVLVGKKGKKGWIVSLCVLTIWSKHLVVGEQ